MIFSLRALLANNISIEMPRAPERLEEAVENSLPALAQCHEGQGDSDNILKQSGGEVASEQLRGKASDFGTADCSNYATDDASQSAHDEVSTREPDGRARECAHHYS